MAVGFSPFDLVVDTLSLASGYDVMTGERLNGFAKKALLAGLVLGAVTGGLGDDLLQFGSRAMRMADNVTDAGRAVARQGDDLIQTAGRRLGSRADDLVQRGRRLAEDLFAGRRIARRLDEYVGEGRRLVDEAADAARLQRRLDDYVSPDGVVARLGNEMVEKQRLARRLDEYVVRGDEVVAAGDDVAETAVRQEFDRQRLLDNLARSRKARPGSGFQQLVETEQQLHKEPKLIVEIGPGPTKRAQITLMRKQGKQTMLEALHEKYPNAQLVAIDSEPEVLERVQRLMEEGRLPKNTILLQADMTKRDKLFEAIKEQLGDDFEGFDLVVNISPEPYMTRPNSEYITTLTDLAKPRGEIIGAYEGTSYINSGILKDHGATVKAHLDTDLSSSQFLPTENVYSGWINDIGWWWEFRLRR